MFKLSQEFGMFCFLHLAALICTAAFDRSIVAYLQTVSVSWRIVLVSDWSAFLRSGGLSWKSAGQVCGRPVSNTDSGRSLREWVLMFSGVTGSVFQVFGRFLQSFREYNQWSPVEFFRHECLAYSVVQHDKEACLG